jgi:hypothetical protein
MQCILFHLAFVKWESEVRSSNMNFVSYMYYLWTYQSGWYIRAYCAIQMLIVHLFFLIFGKYYAAKRFWFCSMHEFYNGYVEIYIYIYFSFSAFYDNIILLIISCLLLIHHMECDIKDLEFSWKKKCLLQLPLVQGYLLSVCLFSLLGVVIYTMYEKVW